MKKKITLLLAGAIIASVLGGCAAPAGTASPAPSAESTEEKADTAGGTLVMATNAEFPPYEYYDGNGEYKLIQIPVFDSNLLDFVKTAGKTALVDRNYPYVYTRYRCTSAPLACCRFVISVTVVLEKSE